MNTLIIVSLISCCTFPWWLAWLLPFLLGLGIGYLLWARYKDMVAELEDKVSTLELRVKGLEADLDACKKQRMEAEGNLSMLKGRIREMEAVPAQIVSTNVATATPFAAAFADAAKSISPEDKYFAAIGNDKLQIIEGIGPKMQEVLNENGILTFNHLGSKSSQDLRAILDKYGDKYRIIDPNTWPQQANMADRRNWAELITLQKALDTSRSDTATDHETDSKLENFLVKIGLMRKWKQDDLKAVEGIGPKINELMHKAGINTWAALSSTTVEDIQSMLDEGGSNFSLAEPATWPKQADMAAKGQWDELQSYQDEINAGRVK